MPPRFAYWTILIDNTATAFRAQHAEDLLPTLVQLRRTNKDVVMKWFARGRLWESPEAARAAAQKPKVSEKRGRDWRPGGKHKDPRARFDKRSAKPPAPSFRKPHHSSRKPGHSQKDRRTLREADRTFKNRTSSGHRTFNNRTSSKASRTSDEASRTSSEVSGTSGEVSRPSGEVSRTSGKDRR